MRSAINIFFVGFKGSGKTSVGKATALKLGREFIDTDHLIESLHQKRKGEKLSFREIFRKEGAPYFRELEQEALEGLKGLKDKVVSLGGGTPAHLKDHSLLKSAVVIYLHVEKGALFERIMADGRPPFFDEGNPRKSFDELWDNRTPLYRKLARLVIDNYGRPVRETADEVIEKVRKHGW